MTGSGGRDPHPAAPRRRAPAGPGGLTLTLAVALLAALAAACGTSTSPTPTATRQPSPATSAGTSPDGSGGSGPRATPWVGNAVLGIEALGVADGEIRKGINEFNAGVQGSDPELMLNAATQLSGIDVLLANVERIEIFPPMRPFADAYRAAITAMDAAATELKAALEAGDADATTSASRDLVAAFTAYADLQAQLAGYVYQIPEQKRLLTQ
jgi:hypothetical protein